MSRTPLDKLSAISPDVAAGFKMLRTGVLDAGPLGHDVVELVVVGALAATRKHEALRVHLRRLVTMGVDAAAIRQVIVAPLGAASTLTETVEALDVLDEVVTAAAQ